MKEEAVLFPLLESSHAAVTVVWALRQQHESQRELVGLLARTLDAGGLEALGVESRTYVARVREHLLIEKRFFAEVAADKLSPIQALARQFESIERRSIGATGREWHTQLIADYRDIVSTWGIGPTSELRRPLLRAAFLQPLEIFDERLDPRLDRLL